MDEHDPLIERLRGLGRHNVDPSLASRHLDAMASSPHRTVRSAKVKVGAAFFAGLVLGGTGLASAGTLPGPAQGVAHTALSAVGIDVPNSHGPARYNGPECTGGPYRNHGQYVRAHQADLNAGKSRCGKPIQAGTGAANDGTEPPEKPGNDQGGASGAAHGKSGNKGKPAVTSPTTGKKPASTRPAPAAPKKPASGPGTTVPSATSIIPSTTTSTSTPSINTTSD
jgi:hypothetical protein